MTERGINQFDCSAEHYILFSVQREFDTELFTDVTKVEIKRREKVGDKLHLTVVTCANGDIPPALQKMVTPKMLTWTETGVWDLKKNVYEYSVEPFYFANILSMSGRFEIRDKGAGKIEVPYESKCVIKLPILGAIGEKAILSAQKKNLESARPRITAKMKNFTPVFTY